MKAFILWLDHMSSKMIFVNEDIMELEGDNDFAPPPPTHFKLCNRDEW